MKKIPTKSLTPNPHNPRMLFDREPLAVLKASIEKVGILVPLTVYWRKAKKRWVILDGQRRWMCAQELDLKNVPVNEIAEPTSVQNIVTMFQIHSLRADWELMPTALKLELLMRELHERNDRKLAELTRLDRAVVSRCKKLLSYPEKDQDLMLDPDPHKRMKADFFIELYAVRNDRLVNSMPWFSKNRFTQRMIIKYKNRMGLKAGTDFRIMKQYINNARAAGKAREITRKLGEFTNNDELTLAHLSIESADVAADARKIVKSIKKLQGSIRKIDAKEFYGEEGLWKALENLLRIIRSKLNAADRRLK